ncbi:prepilin-type N-terminal cleavage/methylation domain-containing protein [Ferrimonas sediminicola]|uniref:Prepilin-type N-terminal cleavage/methylation domain-containing protein n=1 Tax=Ferrimonas sediminicola TaxID=2569538 RepID=A0A4V5NVN4_9GAMM|nr:type II secretion system protein [Ferrimonas sediminicola]TKB51211.1 prepilin-type N-terminal cleavage/methylation domain-containing protein [Ferrimonas sediminicola]
MKAQRGFTLIELVIVIIVLGILAVTAAPKFIDLQTDARTATLNGAKGSLQGANALVYAKAAVNGVEGDDCTGVTTGGCNAVNEDISVLPIYGAVPATETAVKAVAELDGAEWTFTEGADANAGKLYVTPKNVTAKPTATDADDDACQLIYTQASQDATTKVVTPASYIVVKGGC